MNAIIETINSAGRAFVEFMLPMLIQSSVLILILLALDVLLRRRVRAVFRYWIWMLVLVKLVLPPSLGSPVSIGTWLGETLEPPQIAVDEPLAPQPQMPPAEWQPQAKLGDGTPVVVDHIREMQTSAPGVAAASDRVPTPEGAMSIPETPSPAAPTLGWQAVVLLVWLAIVSALSLLLLQRAWFVRGLVVQAQEVPPSLRTALEQCRSRMGVARPISLRLSPNATSPAVCGLLRPVILIPQSLAPQLQPHDLQAVLLHELAHIKRGDLSVNLIQTLLQIVYFYNPLLWLANVMIRRAREQAVDEAVLVAMGETAPDYPETLLHVAKLAFHRRPALSLRLIGVVESKSALRSRIQHILARPLPKTAKLGLLGLVAVFLIAAVLLPMAKARPLTDRARSVMSLADEEARRLNHDYVGTEHILLALARQEDAVSAKVLANLGADIDTLRGEVNKLVQPGTEPVTRRTLPRMPRAEKAMQYAKEEAKSLGHDYVGTEHILLALLRDKDSVAAQTLAGLGITQTQVRAQVLTFVQPGGQDPKDDDDEGAGGGVLVEAHAPESSGVVAKLPNGVTVEFLAYSQLVPRGGLFWFDPQGQETTIPGVYEADVDGLGTILALRVEPAESRVIAQLYRGPDSQNIEKQWQLAGTSIWLLPLGDERNFANLRIITELRMPAVIETIPLTEENLGQLVEVNRCGIARIVDLQVVENLSADMLTMQMGYPPGLDMGLGGMAEPPTLQFSYIRAPDCSQAVVAFLDEEGRTYPAKPIRLGSADSYRGILWPNRLAGIVVEAAPVHTADVRLRNISLTPERVTEIQIEPAAKQGVLWRLSYRHLVLESLTNSLRELCERYGGRFPASLADLQNSHDPDAFRWITTHMAYSGQGKSPDDGPRSVIAYDKTLLAEGRGTYVLYSDGQFEFESPVELAELGILPQNQGAIPPDSADPLSGDGVGSNAIGKPRFTVHGVVTDASGRPMEGVSVSVDCGFERPQRAGRTLTDEAGRYTLGFESAWVVADADPYGVGIQPAFVYARKDGFYETSLCHKGNLAMAGKAPGLAEQRFVAGRAGVVLVNEPYELNFVMVPAALLTGQLVDADGRAMANHDLWLFSGQMYPPHQSHIRIRTGSDGTFGPYTLPCISVRFHAAQPHVARSDEIAFTRAGNWRVTLKYRQTGSQTAQLLVEDLQGPADRPSNSVATGSQPTAPGLSGGVLDPNGAPAAGAQVAWIDAERSVSITDGRLMAPRFGDRGKGPIIETDERGHFRFEEEPNDGFSLLAAHDAGFALIGAEQFAKDRVVRLQRWGRVEGRVARGREPLEGKIWMGGLPNSTWFEHRRDFNYEVLCDAQGRFTFKRVPPGWFEVGYLTRMGDSVSSHTSRTPIVVEAGQTATMTLGGEGRPVIGRFVPPPDWEGPIYFGAGLRALDTVRPDPPRPADYDQMTNRQQQDWYRQWRKTPEAQAYYDAIWQNLDQRHYTFHIADDGTFRIKDVIPGKYRLTVWLEERFSGGGRLEEFGGYSGTIEVPPMDEAYSDEPLDAGDLVLKLRRPLHVGDMAPLFEAQTLDGKDIRLADYRGRFVLLSFWHPASHPELDRLKELHATYGATGRLQIVGLGGSDTLDEVKKFIAEQDVLWPQVYFGQEWDQGIARQYGLPGLPYILLIDPDGKIVATWLREQKLTDAVCEGLAAFTQD